MAEKITIEQLVGQGLEESEAKDITHRVNQLIGSVSASDCWQRISKEILTPEHPFDVHKFLYTTVYSDWDSSHGPPPAWIPSIDFIKTTNMAKLMEEQKVTSYEDLHKWSVQNRVDFWEAMIRRLGILFKQAFTEVVDLSCGVESPRWIPGAKLNIIDSCFNADYDSTAIIYQREGVSLSTMTYRELDLLTNRVANGLTDIGFSPGDTIAIYMPMTAESVAIYMGIVKAGYIAVSVADSFAPDEIEKRLRLADAKGVFTQDYILRGGKQLPLYEKVISASAPKAIVLPGANSVSIKLRNGDIIWDEFLSSNERFCSVSCNPHDYTNILFSSGTTGDPKVIPWTQTTPIKCAVDGYLHHNIQPGDVIAWPTNLGWMMGPWLIYASLINQATIALYYDTPTARGFGRFVQDAKVNILGVVPSMVRTWKSTECMKRLDWGTIKVFSSTGECSNPEEMLFLMSLAGYRPIIEYCGGTEIGGGYITGTVVQPSSPATFSTPALGLDFVILDEEGHCANNGELFLVPPSIGLSTELLNQDHQKVYFEGAPKGPHDEVLRRHGDQVERLGKGYYRAHGRVDDTMKVSGIMASSVEIERILNTVKGVNETAAVAVTPAEGGPAEMVVYAVLAPGTNTKKEELKDCLQGAIKRHLNPLFKIYRVEIVDLLPRTASNKVIRRALHDRYKDSISGKQVL